MKKVIYLFISLLVLVTLFLAWNSLLKTESSKSQEKHNNQEYHISVDKKEMVQTNNLTSEEENELKKLIPQVLAWTYRWNLNLSCYQDTLESIQTRGAGNEKKWMEKYKKSENKETKVRVEVLPGQIIAYVDQIGVKIRINRINGTRLEALGPEQICYPIPKNTNSYTIQVPSLVSSKVFSVENEEAKKRLYERVVKLVKKNACFSLSNSSNNETIRITLPNFNIGDPEIYVLLQGNKTEYSNGVSIDWIRFDLNNQDEEFYPILDKNFGLPDEVTSFVKPINQYKLESFEVSCSEP